MTSGIIDRYMDELKAGNESVVEFYEPLSGEEKKDDLAPYKECAERGGRMEVVFNFADREGNLSVADRNGVMIMLKKDDLVEDLDFYNSFVKDRFLANAFTVKITSIDEDDMIVYVSSARSGQNSTKRKITREIQEKLKRGEMVHVAGRPTRIDSDCVYIDILCKGILGMCMVNVWQKAFTRYLEAECSKDYIYDFVITGQLEPVKGRPAAFALSRVPFTKDPWDVVGEQFTEGSVLLIKCIDRPEGKSYWWGKSPLVEGLDIMCDYNDRMRITYGGVYKCKIKAVDCEKHIFKAAPFAQVRTGDGIDDSGVVRFLEERVKKPVRSRR